MSNIVAIPQNNAGVAQALRTIADQIDQGELAASTAIVILRDRQGECVSVCARGDCLPISSEIGLFEYAKLLRWDAFLQESC